MWTATTTWAPRTARWCTERLRGNSRTAGLELKECGHCDFRDIFRQKYPLRIFVEIARSIACSFKTTVCNLEVEDCPKNMNEHGRISIERIEQATSVIGPEFLNSPQFECEPLSVELGARVVVKIETLNPIRSFKGRGSELYMSKVPAGSEVVCASAGNFGQAMAYSARRRNVRVTVYAARNANPLKLERMKSLGADVRQ